jgi:parallel beta-helix repeat protein
MKSILIISILLVSIFMILNPVSAATYNVYPGDDIEAIIEGASAGDTIYVHAGTHYPDGTISIQADHITIIGDDPFTTMIDGTGLDDVITTNFHNYMVVRNLNIQNANDDGIEVEEYCEVTNCIIKNCNDGIVYDTQGHHNTIRYCTILNCEDDGIQVYDYNTIENCIVIGNGGDGFDMGEDCTLKNCLSYDNGDDGFDDEEDCTYINCTAANNWDDGFYDDDGGTTIINCIAVGNDEDGFDIDEDYLSEITYSNAWGNADEDYEGAPAGTGSISQDPKFVTGYYSWPGWFEGDNIAYFLSPGSPCIDRGSTASSALGLERGWSTTLTERCDTNIVDMGFHFASNCNVPTLPIAKILEILKGNQE